MKLIYVSPLIDFQNGKYYVDYMIQKANGQLVSMQKICNDSLEADCVYAELMEILQHDNPGNVVIVDNESIYTL